MNEEIVKRLKRKNENLFNHVSLGSNNKEIDYIVENYLIGGIKRNIHEINSAINNNL